MYSNFNLSDNMPQAVGYPFKKRSFRHLLEKNNATMAQSVFIFTFVVVSKWGNENQI
jgi:hypothetical protein